MLQIYTGCSVEENSRTIYQKIISESLKHPEREYRILVPDQASLQVTQRLTMMHPNHGLWNIEVVTFRMLARTVFEELHISQNQILDENGKTMLLREVLSGKTDELGYFGKRLTGRPGFVSELKGVFSEFLQCMVSPEKLLSLTEESSGKNPAFSRKLKDLTVLYSSFMKELEEKYSTTELRMKKLAECICQSEILKGQYFSIDGFHGFTPVQMEVLRELMRIVPELNVTLTVDSTCLKLAPDPFELFYPTHRLYSDLCRTAEKEGISQKQFCIKDSEFFLPTEKSDDLAQLSFRYSSGKGKRPSPESEHIHLIQCKNPQEEIKVLLETVLGLIREGCLYSDIGIIAGDLSDYVPTLSYYLNQAGIPYFLDQTRDFSDHPAVRFLIGSLEILEQDFSYESMFRLFRCGLFPMDSEILDEVENYCLAAGIRGWSMWKREWKRKTSWTDDEMLAEYNEYREQIVEILSDFVSEMKKKDLTGSERTEVLRNFLNRVSLHESLKILAEELEERGDLAKKQEYLQVTEKLDELLEQYENLLGEKLTSLTEFREILSAGIQEIQIGVIPPVMDRMVIGDLRRTRMPQVKILFVLGANEGKLPAQASEKGILSDLDRALFEESGLSLSGNSRQQNLEQRFYLYLLLEKPTEELYLLASATDADGKPLRLSPLYADIRRFDPHLKTENRKTTGILTEEATFEKLAAALREQALQGRTAEFGEAEEAASLYRWYLERNNRSERQEELLSAAFFAAPKENLNEQVAKELYEDRRASSVSQLESYSGCAFSYFLNYGLKLKEREQYEIDQRDFGNLMHRILQQVFLTVSRQGSSLSDLNEETKNRIAAECAAEVMSEYGEGILQGTARNEYLSGLIGEMSTRTVSLLSEQMSRGDFRPLQAEMGFSPNEIGEVLRFPLPDGREISLSGSIDRVDVSVEQDEIYVNVIDYKTGNTSWNFSDIWNGISLQLPLYMDAAMELVQKKTPGKKVFPGGMYYLHLDARQIADAEKVKEDAGQVFLSEMRLDGITVIPKDGFSRIDRSEGKSSEVVKGLKKTEGRLEENGTTVTEEKMRLLLAHSKRLAQGFAEDVYSGKIAPNPYRSGSTNRCEYCPYRAVCAFDERLPGYRMRNLAKMDAKEFWKEIEGKEGENVLDRKSEESH